MLPTHPPYRSDTSINFFLMGMEKMGWGKRTAIIFSPYWGVGKDIKRGGVRLIF
jgi:hypothetical protein